MARLYKRGDIYYIDYGVGGKRIRKRIGKNQRIAEFALKDIEVKLEKKDVGIIERKEIGLDAFFDKYLEYSKTNHAPFSTKRFKAIINNFKYFIEHFHPAVIRLHDLNPGVFEEFKTFRRNPPEKTVKDESCPFNLKKKAKTKTVNMETQSLRTTLNLAKKWGYLKDNPSEGVGYLKEDDVKPPRFLTSEEVEKILKEADKEMYPIIYTFLYTGMRKSELKNLEWSDIKFDRKLIQIRNKAHWKPKTGERDIPIHGSLLKLFKDLVERKHPKTSLVFHTKDGKQIDKVRDRFMKLTKRCGYPDITKVHSLRHTYASHLVMAGVDLPTVQKLMGHADIATTMIYAHLAPSHLIGAVDKLDF